MNQLDEWPGAWTARIGEAVRAGRAYRGISAQELSDRCEAVGYRVPRNTITNLENGRKASIPLHELFVMSKALDIPIVMLACYPDEDGRLPMPGGQQPAASALLEMTGERWSGRLGGRFDLLVDHRYVVLVVADWYQSTRELKNLQGRAEKATGQHSEFLQKRISAVEADRTRTVDQLAAMWRDDAPVVESLALPVDLQERILAQMKEVSRLNHPSRSAGWDGGFDGE